MMNAGYSKTPLGRKLGVKKGFRVLLHNTPKHYFDLFEDWPEEVQLLNKIGRIWISWPKGTSKIETDLNKDLIRDYVLRTTGLVDVKVAAIDQDWSGLKFVYRLENR